MEDFIKEPTFTCTHLRLTLHETGRSRRHWCRCLRCGKSFTQDRAMDHALYLISALADENEALKKRLDVSTEELAREINQVHNRLQQAELLEMTNKVHARPSEVQKKGGERCRRRPSTR